MEKIYEMNFFLSHQSISSIMQIKYLHNNFLTSHKYISIADTLQ